MTACINWSEEILVEQSVILETKNTEFNGNI